MANSSLDKCVQPVIHHSFFDMLETIRYHYKDDFRFKLPDGARRIIDFLAINDADYSRSPDCKPRLYELVVRPKRILADLGRLHTVL
jgi:hypothetical protein